MEDMRSTRNSNVYEEGYEEKNTVGDEEGNANFWRADVLNVVSDVCSIDQRTADAGHNAIVMATLRTSVECNNDALESKESLI